MRPLIFIVFIFLFSSNILSAQAITEQTTIVDKPVIRWGKYFPGRMKADSFKIQSQIIVSKDYKLKKATLYFCGANFPTVEKLDIYSQDLSKIEKTISKCGPGSVVIIEKILVDYKNEQEIFLNNASFLLY